MPRPCLAPEPCCVPALDMVANGFSHNVPTSANLAELNRIRAQSRSTPHRSFVPLPFPRHSPPSPVFGNSSWPHNARQQRGHSAAVAAERGSGRGDEGDPALQDNLVSMLRLQIGKKHVDAFVDAEEEKLKQSVEEVTGDADFLQFLLHSSRVLGKAMLTGPFLTFESMHDYAANA